MSSALLLIVSLAAGSCPEAKLLAPLADTGGIATGSPVALDGDVAVIGLPWDEGAGNSAGAAGVFHFDGMGWAPAAKVRASNEDQGHRFGWAVDVSGDRVLVGSVGHGASVFRFDFEDSSWVEEALFLPPGPYVGQVGVTVSLGGTRAIVGHPGADPCYPVGTCPMGTVYVFERTGSTWTQVASLTRTDGEAPAAFGTAIVLEGDVAAVRATEQSGLDSLSVFRADGPEWVEEARLTASDGVAGDGFGASLALDGETLLIGAPFRGDAEGAAYVFRYDAARSEWVEEAILVAPEPAAGDDFGSAVAIEGDVALVGAHGKDLVADSSGAAYIFRFDGVAWDAGTLVTPIDAHVSQDFGYGVALSGGRAVFGAREFESACGVAGSGYIFEVSGPGGRDCNGNGTCDTLDLNAGDSPDCNGNGVPDECDLAGGSTDCNGNRVPDECDADCNGNGVPDDCDLVAGTSRDCNDNGRPDECDPGYAIDDGSIESVVGVVAAGEPHGALWLNRFVVEAGRETIDAIGVDWKPCHVPLGGPVTLLLYGDPDNDGDPADAVLLASTQVHVAETAGKGITFVPVPPTVVGQAGDSFFVGASVDSAGSYIPLDTSPPFAGESWSVIAEAGAIDLENLTNNLVPPCPIDECCGCQGNWVLRARAAPAGGCWCATDLTGDCTVNADDVEALLRSWGPCPEPCPVSCAADVDGDCTVGIIDLLILLASWDF